MEPFLRIVALFLVLINPVLLAVHLHGALSTLDARTSHAVLLRAAVATGIVFSLFAATGDWVFSQVLQVRFASFLLFGGAVFLVLALRLVMNGPETREQLMGVGSGGASSGRLAGAIAMPFLIGPGTVSASVLAGARLPLVVAVLAIAVVLAVTMGSVLVLERLHDRLQRAMPGGMERYTDVVNRISALVLGTVAVDMILNGIERWRESSPW